MKLLSIRQPVITGSLIQKAMVISLILVISAFIEASVINMDDTNSIGIKMIPIAPGTFQMGSNNPLPEDWDEEPAHKVTITAPFYISETEVTIGQYQTFRAGFSGSMTEGPYMVGISWYDATAFCEWLSKKEGKTYRLPTEAEWEYAARAGTDSPFWAGNKPPQPEEPNPWGLKNVHTGPLEWCYDWYGLYSHDDQKDPLGPETGITRVIRGGGLDRKTPHYARSRNRASYGASFAIMAGTNVTDFSEGNEYSAESTLEGIIGVWYGTTKFDNSKAVDHMTTLNVDWNDFQQPGEDRETQWSAHWEGTLIAPANGEITFHVASDYSVVLSIDNQNVVDWEGAESEKSGKIVLEKDIHYPIRIRYIHNRGERSYLNINWSWQGQEKAAIPKANLLHSRVQQKKMTRIVPRTYLPGHHSIGFRIVQGDLSEIKPLTIEKPFFQQCIIQNQSLVNQGPDPGTPWYRRRPVVPIPPTDVSWEASRAVGLPKGMWPHIHNPGLGICPNGDLLASFYTAKLGPRGEDQPEVLLIGTRLRFGADQWDMPDIFIDFADVNTTSPCFYKEGQTLYLFCGHTFYDRHYPFQWITSTDNGGTWNEPYFPQITNDLGPYTPQPINTIFRGNDGVWYVPTDGYGGTSVLWASKDNGRTWIDTGGRTFGRHTTFQMLKDGRILGMGGKKTHIDGYMPKSISSDGGKNWIVSKTPFSEMGGNQRPCLIRLQSGRLFMCGDFQHKSGRHPEGVKQRGSYVALSDDEGETWHIKQLKGTLTHYEDNLYETIGYSVARQAPNGIIHILSSATTPLQHFEINEAWILNEKAAWDLIYKPKVIAKEEYKEFYPSGKIKTLWQGGVTTEGLYMHQGQQIWYYESGQKQWEVNWEGGRKTGDETFWDASGGIRWTWRHNNDGTSIWTQYWSNGNKRSESSWYNFRAEGSARRWDLCGNLISEKIFSSGRMQ